MMNDLVECEGVVNVLICERDQISIFECHAGMWIGVWVGRPSCAAGGVGWGWGVPIASVRCVKEGRVVPVARGM
jgi:hypothetical protein